MASLLIIDDSDLFRDAIKSSISGFEIIEEAANSQEGLMKVEMMKPDLVLLDLSMPGGSGLMIIDKIKNISKKTKILVLTVQTHGELASMLNGSDGFILKDCGRDILKEAIASLMEGKKFICSGFETDAVE
jgi:DNA-binding NarL/FixJ family response regulator